jgi:hypothetical protein
MGFRDDLVDLWRRQTGEPSSRRSRVCLMALASGCKVPEFRRRLECRASHLWVPDRRKKVACPRCGGAGMRVVEPAEAYARYTGEVPRLVPGKV